MTATKSEAKQAKKAAAKKTARKTTKTAKKAVKASSNGVGVAKPPPFTGETTPLKKPASTKHTMPEGQIVISRIGTETIRVHLRGIAPLITHKFSEKAKRSMLDAMQGHKNPKEPKNPEQEFRDAAYRLDDGGYGIPAIAVKSCTVSAARLFDKSVTMVGLRQCIFVEGEFSRREGQMLARINGQLMMAESLGSEITNLFSTEPEMREDVVRVGNGGTDLRYRPCWIDWRTSVDVTYIKSMLTRDSVLSLIEAGGMTVGIGEWRPERRGEYGRFVIDTERQVEILST